METIGCDRHSLTRSYVLNEIKGRLILDMNCLSDATDVTMSTQVGIGKNDHRNPKIASREAVDMARASGSIEKADFVFLFASVGYDQNTIVKHVYEFAGGTR